MAVFDDVGHGTDILRRVGGGWGGEEEEGKRERGRGVEGREEEGVQSRDVKREGSCLTNRLVD